MAKLTGTQKKKRNQFVALLIAILVVAAAIFFVVYSSVMAKSAFLENADFATALGQAFDKAVRKVSAEDLAGVKYVELYNDGENGSVFVGYDDFVEQYEKYTAEVEAAQAAEEAGEEEIPEVTTEHPVNLAKGGTFEGAEEITLNDIKYFTGAEIVSCSNILLDKESLGGFKNLRKANFSYCGIDNEDLAAFASGLNLEQVEELVFMGNSVDDWSPLESISDKVTLQSYGYTIDDEGQLQMTSNEQTLTEYLEEKAKAEEEAAKAEAETETETEAEAKTETEAETEAETETEAEAESETEAETETEEVTE